MKTFIKNFRQQVNEVITWGIIFVCSLWGCAAVYAFSPFDYIQATIISFFIIVIGNLSLWITIVFASAFESGMKSGIKKAFKKLQED